MIVAFDNYFECIELRLLFVGWEMDLNSESMRKHFEEKLSNLPGDESYFLLTTFANMAMARNNQDYEFVRAATIDLFQVYMNTYNFKRKKKGYKNVEFLFEFCRLVF